MTVNEAIAAFDAAVAAVKLRYPQATFVEMGENGGSYHRYGIFWAKHFGPQYPSDAGALIYVEKNAASGAALHMCATMALHDAWHPVDLKTGEILNNWDLA